jgi:hypothetical protein
MGNARHWKETGHNEDQAFNPAASARAMHRRDFPT